MMKKYLSMTILAALILGCETDDNESSYGGTAPPPPESGNSVNLSSNASFGNILVDESGNALYFFANDATGAASNCNGGCADAWPPFYAADLSVGSGLNSADFSTISRDDGSDQTTYKGFPLYFFANDASPGDVNGDGSGGVWFIAKPDYAVMAVRAQLVGETNSGESVDLGIDGLPSSDPTTYMTDDRGNTLYRFSQDNALQNNFTADDFSNDGVWPIYASSGTAIPSIFDEGDFQTIEINGREQLTFRGHPLYGFGQDTSRGDNKGVGFPQPGIWFVVNQTTTPAETAINAVRLSNDASFGSVLTDAEGNTLYFFANDAKNLSSCNGGCADAWPPFYVEDLTWDQGLLGADFSTIERADGSSQITYKGYPLYTFANDASPGDINGDGAGGVWFVAKPDYAIMVSRQQLVGRDNNGNLLNLLEDGSLGEEATKYITDDRGNTLYRFINDINLTNNFTATDFSNNGAWPIYASENTAIPSIYDSGDFAIVDVFGEPQLTFKGWPLYRFGQDGTKGDTFGVGFPQPGIWFINNANTIQAPQNASTIYDENGEGDLSGDHTAPQGPFVLVNGSNIVMAHQQGSPRDVDYFTIEVPVGQQLTGLTLLGYEASAGNLAFIGIVSGSNFPNDANSTGASDLLGGTTYGAQDLNENILEAMGNLGGAQGFSGPLPAGTYSIWLNQTGPNSEATLSFELTAG